VQGDGCEMNGSTEVPSATVPQPAKQAEEVRSRWRWTEPTVWTDRMLTALETGVKGGRWFSLMDKVYASGNLRAAFARAKASHGAPGVDHQTIEMFEARLAENVQRLEDSLRSGTYRPQAVLRTYIPKPGSRERRPLGIPTVRDRVVQGALRNVLEPIFERDFVEHSYGFRPGRGCKDALRRVDDLLKAGYTFVVDADLKSYFDTIPHERLMELLGRKVTDGKILALLWQFLQQGVLEGMSFWTPEEGTPQGAVVSPLLSNIYLDPLDHLMAQEGFAMVRYADDFVVLCRSAEEAQRALDLIYRWTEEAGLTLHPEKTRIVNSLVTGFDFLGYHFVKHRRFVRKKSLAKFKAAIRAKTLRANGHSLSEIINRVNATLRGWFEYFKHSHYTTFTSLDGWVRGRLRSILRRRQHRRGRARGTDHHRWPNAYFAEQGLYCLVLAHVQACQSSRR
jgi:RNA-directed DNA polymerase